MYLVTLQSICSFSSVCVFYVIVFNVLIFRMSEASQLPSSHPRYCLWFALVGAATPLAMASTHQFEGETTTTQ